MTRHPHADWLLARHEAETVPCPTCGVGVGVTCVNSITGETPRFPAHPARIRAAEKAAEEEQ